MNWPDFVNGIIFEFIGSLFIWLGVRQIYKDKRLAGWNPLSTVFFTAWGYWNLYYYPSLGQWWSFAGGVSIVLANTFWIALMWKYRRASTWYPEFLTSLAWLSDVIDQILERGRWTRR